MGFRMLFSNIGYARGIDGTLWQHISRATRHLYCSVPLQQAVLLQLKGIVTTETPDICCFVEIDEGSIHSARFNQLGYLLDDDYRFFDCADKYGPNSWIGRMPLHIGKSSAFMAKRELPFERLYFSKGSKRLIHKVVLPQDIVLYFTHFSLQRKIRHKQFEELKKLMAADPRPVILMADFNIMHGFKELAPLLGGTDLRVLNKETDHTFQIHRSKHTLDLCLCSESLVDRLQLKIIPQPFSDHAALLVDMVEQTQ